MDNQLLFFLLSIIPLIFIPGGFTAEVSRWHSGNGNDSPIVVYDAGELLPDGSMLSSNRPAVSLIPTAKERHPQQDYADINGRLRTGPENDSRYPNRGRDYYARNTVDGEPTYPYWKKKMPIQEREKKVIFIQNPNEAIGTEDPRRFIRPDLEGKISNQGSLESIGHQNSDLYPESRKRVVIYPNPAGRDIYPQSAKKIVVFPEATERSGYPEGGESVVIIPRDVRRPRYPERAERIVSYPNPAGQDIYPRSAKRVVYYPNPAGQSIYPQSAKRVVIYQDENDGEVEAKRRHQMVNNLRRTDTILSRGPTYGEGRRIVKFPERVGEGPIPGRTFLERPHEKMYRPIEEERTDVRPQERVIEYRRFQYPTDEGDVQMRTFVEERGPRWRGRAIPVRRMEVGPSKNREISTGEVKENGEEEKGEDGKRVQGIREEGSGLGGGERWKGERETDVLPTSVGASKGPPTGKTPLPAFIRDAVDSFVFGKPSNELQELPH